MEEIRFVKLVSHDEWREAFPVISSLRSRLRLDGFLQSRSSLLAEGYRLFGLRVAEELVTVAGCVLTPHVSRKRDFWIRDLATLPERRSQGLGSRMLDELTSVAKELGCFRICLNTRTVNSKAIAFYKRFGFSDYALFMDREISG